MNDNCIFNSSSCCVQGLQIIAEGKNRLHSKLSVKHLIPLIYSCIWYFHRENKTVVLAETLASVMDWTPDLIKMTQMAVDETSHFMYCTALNGSAYRVSMSIPLTMLYSIAIHSTHFL